MTQPQPPPPHTHVNPCDKIPPLKEPFKGGKRRRDDLKIIFHCLAALSSRRHFFFKAEMFHVWRLTFPCCFKVLEGGKESEFSCFLPMTVQPWSQPLVPQNRARTKFMQHKFNRRSFEGAHSHPGSGAVGLGDTPSSVGGTMQGQGSNWPLVCKACAQPTLLSRRALASAFGYKKNKNVISEKSHLKRERKIEGRERVTVGSLLQCSGDHTWCWELCQGQPHAWQNPI